MFSASPVQFRDQSIAGRGVFARKRFEPGDLIVPYAPKQRRLAADEPEARAAADTKLTLLSDGAFEEQRGSDWSPRWWTAPG